MSKRQGMQKLGKILADLDWDRKKYITREFQDYGYRLSIELNDLAHKALYIKLAKETPRRLLEEAKVFVKEAYEVNNKARLFMWKLKQLREEKNSKKKRAGI